MKLFKVTYTLNESLHYTCVEAMTKDSAAEEVYEKISEMYPEDDYEYMNSEEVYDNAVKKGQHFIENGNEYEWLNQHSEEIIDFDVWAVWSARNLDTDEIEYFVVENDTGFIDWGPCETKTEANEFLQSKLADDELEEDLDEEPMKGTHAEPIEPGVDSGMAGVINSLITDEYEAIDGYNNAMVTASAANRDDILSVLADIQREEHVHIGQLQQLLKLFDPNAAASEDGNEEAETQLSDSDDLTIEEVDFIEKELEKHPTEDDIQ